MEDIETVIKSFLDVWDYAVFIAKEKTKDYRFYFIELLKMNLKK